MTSRIFRHSYQDAYLVALSLLHPVALFLAPSIPLIAVGVWWNSNTIAHHFVHLPFFKSNTVNRLYSLYLSLLLGIPQSIWHDRHFAHHRGATMRLQWSRATIEEILLISVLWGLLLASAPHFFLMVYLPGYLFGLVICHLHGHFEHAGGTTSNYGVIYNLAFFNDGYHVEHHRSPSKHWTQMRELSAENVKTSRWPAVLRWMEWIHLETLERLVLRSQPLQWFLLKTHGKALRKHLRHLSNIRSVTIVGGGMYPRTALLLRKLLPGASIRIVDANGEHLEIAKPFLDDAIRFDEALYGPGHPSVWNESDLLVIPLSFTGSRDAIYENPPSQAVLVHDWIWRKRGRSAIVSLLLLKRLNLILR